MDTSGAYLVLGAGKSGLAAAQLLRSHGQEVTVISDPHIPDNLARFKHLVLSPGVSPRHPLLMQGLQLQVWSELDVAWHWAWKGVAEVIGVTGTNGKSSLVSWLAQAAGERVTLAGNIGVPLSACEPRSGRLILELSSYQLAQSSLLTVNTAVFLNFSPDHLSWHGSLEEYFRSKWRVLAGAKRVFLSSQVCDFATAWGLRPPSAAEIVSEDLNPELIQSILSTDEVVPEFMPLEHRLQVFAGKRSELVNDSKASNLAATLFALARTEGPFSLWLGGQRKDSDEFQEVLRYRDKISSLWVFGESGESIAVELAELRPRVFRSLAEAVLAWDREAVLGRVLFSPGCASYDEFSDFEARGGFFMGSLGRGA